MAYFDFDRDWRADMPLADQARELVQQKLDEGVRLVALKTDQEVVVGSCPAGTVLWLFHNAILEEIEDRM
ncbi:hypothetical protein B0T24DRAFT_688048 [Lasiosphaeria ovina]|uniref:Uncharacterized protein n=1 Tax=Lasiosphaeria ovina TaxID=92902 RepID=A0AAE0NL42_9PEZI|nr:hypothetical protein B0T24DRAFT_688048 [Lasiosphaeria ovina]